LASSLQKGSLMKIASQLSAHDLERIVGGGIPSPVYRVGLRAMRGYVNSVKTLQRLPNQADGYLVNHLGSQLPNAVETKIRGWLGGTSISNLTAPMRYNEMKNFPRTAVDALLGR
jgi:hypothetical protein